MNVVHKNPARYQGVKVPKIVPDIQNRIISVAETHFNQDGFEGTDMREIAAEADIAVGTIYLHFHNKETLYEHVISHSWESLRKKVEEIAQSPLEPEVRLKQALQTILQEMTGRKSMSSLWMEIGSIHHQQAYAAHTGNHFSGLRDPISKVITGILKSLAAKQGCLVDEATLDQLGSYIFMMAVDSCMQKRDNPQGQVDLIVDLINSYLHKKDRTVE